MSKFKDAEGREWSVRITMRSAMEVKEATGHNLTTLLDNGLEVYADLYVDSLATLAIVKVLIAKQLRERGVSEESFEESIYGDAISDMADAFHEAYCDFIPSRQGTLLRTLMAETLAAQEAERQTVLSDLTCSNLDSKSPESAELSHGHTASESCAGCPSPDETSTGTPSLSTEPTQSMQWEEIAAGQ